MPWAPRGTWRLKSLEVRIFRGEVISGEGEGKLCEHLMAGSEVPFVK